MSVNGIRSGDLNGGDIDGGRVKVEIKPVTAAPTAESKESFGVSLIYRVSQKKDLSRRLRN